MPASGSPFTVRELVLRGDGLTLFRASRRGTPEPVLLEVREHAGGYELARALSTPSVLRPIEQTSFRGQTAIVLPNYDGVSLKSLLGPPMPIEQFLRVAIAVTEALAGVHREGVVHKDIKPDNILVATGAANAKMIGFGFAARLTREAEVGETTKLVQGSLPFMSPEQTGRMNHGVDERSDLYALGVTFYQMLTGSLPFDATDPLEWVHCHVAREPMRPEERVPAVPRVLSDIVSRLLAKVAEDRYQSAAGLARDLAECLRQWTEKGAISPFVLGAQDVSDRLRPPERLVGRDAELALLRQAFERGAESGSPELVLLAGASGIGKSSLALELGRASLVGSFITGKADQYHSGVPYSTIATALRALVLETLAAGEAASDEKRRALQAALGSEAAVVVDVIPELALLIGAQPPAVVLPAAQAKARFFAMCSRFVGVFVRSGHPLTLFLDDLQWADAGSLELLEHLIAQPDTRHLFILAAYRDSEVGRSHLLVTTTERLRAKGVPVLEVHVGLLTLEHVTELIAETVRVSREEALPLARLVHQKTQGNPFFAIGFLRALVRDGLLRLDRAALRWRWDVSQIEAHDYTDNVVDLMIRKIETLPALARQMLPIAASIGVVSDVRTLARASARTEEEVHVALLPAVMEGLLFREELSYRFLHDRIQQAAHSLVPEAQRATFELAIARALLSAPAEDGEEKKDELFQIAHHFRLGASAITDPHERARIARLFLDAGRKAKAGVAYQSAVTLLSAGAALLEQGADTDDLGFDLHFELAECHWLSGEFEASARSLPMLFDHARTTGERLAVHGLAIRLFAIRGELEKAVDAGLVALRSLDVELSRRPTDAEVAQAYERVWKALDGRPIEALLDLPPMKPSEVAAVELVTLMFDVAFAVDSNLHALLASFAVSASIRHGNTPASFIAYAMFGQTCAERGLYVEARRFAQVAYASLVRPANKPFTAKICLLVGNVVSPWTIPYQNVIDVLERGVREGVSMGDLLFVAYNAESLAFTPFIAGERLEDVSRACDRSIALVERANYREVVDRLRELEAFVDRLRGRGPARAEPPGGARVPMWALSAFTHHLWQIEERYLYEDFEGALTAATEAARWRGAVSALPIVTEADFYEALALAALYRAAPSEEALAKLTACELRFREWASFCRENFGVQHLLVRAELARMAGRALEAEKDYEEAIAVARELGRVHDEAIANEVAARFYRGSGLDSIATMYLKQAHTAYADWGAAGKVRHLEERHPELLEHDTSLAQKSLTAIASPPERLDVMGVIKASQTISGELELDRLIDRLMAVVLEQSGAQRGVLLLVRDGELYVESAATVSSGAISSRRISRLAAGSGVVPESVVHYVRRTGEKLVLVDAADPEGRGRFTDEYFARAEPRSVMCQPIVRRGEAVGVLYLENNLMPGLFTPEHVAALDILASQAAISIGMALYIQRERVARDALARTEGRFRRLADSNMFGIIFADLDGRITDANDFFLEMLGYTREDLALGRLRWTELTPADYAERDRERTREIVRSGACRPYEKEYLRRDGTRVAVLVSAALLEGSESAMVACIVDISERKRAERERDELLVQERRARADAEKALGLRDDFLAIAAHELRTPLTPLRMQIDVLRVLAETAIPEGVSSRSRLLEMLAKSNEQLADLSALMSDLLDISKTQAGHLVLAREKMDLAALVHKLVQRHQPELRRSGSTIDVRGPDSLVGCWDATRIVQVVMNLLTNAIKYGAGRPIEVDLARDGAWAKLIVADHGVGIEAANQQRIFDRFERAVSLRHFGGFGLGLYITREIVRAHGGSIRVESVRGAGATFTVLLPLEAQPTERGSSRTIIA